MAQNGNTIGQIPDFTSDDTNQSAAPIAEEVTEEVKEVAPESAPQETDTPELPAEKPGEEAAAPADSTKQPEVQGEDEKDRAIQGLQEEKVKLLKDIVELRGQKREIKQEQIAQVDKQLDELKDLNPGDVELIERVLRSKGYVNKAEANQMFYKAVEQEEVERFLTKYPEYKPENDPNDSNWNALQKEVGLYKLPSNPKQIFEIMERAHRLIPKVASGPSIPVQKRKLEVASQGAGGTQRPTPNTAKVFDADTRAMLSRGGWSDAEIADMETRRG